MNASAEFYEAFATHYASYYEGVDAGEAVRQWVCHLESTGLIPPAACRVKDPPALLDFGCGPGRHLREWLGAGFRVSGSDISAAMLRLAARNARAGPGTEIPLYRADALREEEWSLLASRFNLVVSHLNFLQMFDARALRRLFGSVVRVLVPGGCWVLDHTTRPMEDLPLIEEAPDPAGGMVRRELRAGGEPGSVIAQWITNDRTLTETWWFHHSSQLEQEARGSGLYLFQNAGWNPLEAVIWPDDSTGPRRLLIFKRPLPDRLQG